MFDDYARYEHLLAALQLAFAMLGMGALLAPRDFVAVFRSPRALSVGLAIQLGLVPLLALALGSLLGVRAGIAAGLVLVAAVPGGTMSNVMTHFAGGNIALSISLTAVTTLGALITTPLVLDVFAGAHLPDDFHMPMGNIAFEIAVVLLLPLALGMLAGHWLGPRNATLARWSIRLSLVFIGLIVVGAGGSGRLDFTGYAASEQASIPLLAVLIFAASLAVVHAARLPGPDRTAIAIEATLRNGNLAVLVKASLFPATRADPIGDGMLFVALLYGGAQMALTLVPVILQRFGRSL